VRVGIGLYPDEPAGQLLQTAQLAERLGYAALWIADSQLLWREMHALMGAVAATTRTIRLGSAVTNLVTRHPTVTASAFRTLDELSAGRVRLGVGTGDSALATLGRRPVALRDFAAAVAELRRLLDGERLVTPEDAAVRLAYDAGRPIPLYIAASGPRMLQLAGRLADGAIVMNGVAPELVAAAIEQVHAGAREAGRDPAEIAIVVWAACHASPSRGEHSFAAVKFNVARTILRPLPGPLDELTRRTAAVVRECYDYAQHGDARAAFAASIPDALVPRFAFAGTPAAISEQIAALAAIGVDEVALAVPSAAASGTRDDVLELLAPVLAQT